VLLCSGKIAWELIAERTKREGDNPRTAIVRVEQLYPNPVEELRAAVGAFPNASDVRWVQDEPANQGPWPHVALHYGEAFEQAITPVTRVAMTAPSVGQHSRHLEEHKSLMQQAFA
jgi:2-oxoglutarate dehydrogenase E1 component